VTSAQRERSTTDTQIKRLEASIQQAESVLDQNKTLEAALKENAQDLKDQRVRLEKLAQEAEAAGYDAQLAQKAKAIQQAEVERDALHAEQSRSSLQANDRAKLDVKKADCKKKSVENDKL
jgi:DNA repair protein RAD50